MFSSKVIQFLIKVRQSDRIIGNLLFPAPNYCYYIRIQNRPSVDLYLIFSFSLSPALNVMHLQALWHLFQMEDGPKC